LVYVYGISDQISIIHFQIDSLASYAVNVYDSICRNSGQWHPFPDHQSSYLLFHPSVDRHLFVLVLPHGYMYLLTWSLSRMSLRIQLLCKANYLLLNLDFQEVDLLVSIIIKRIYLKALQIYSWKRQNLISWGYLQWQTITLLWRYQQLPYACSWMPISSSPSFLFASRSALPPSLYVHSMNLGSREGPNHLFILHCLFD